MMRNRLTDNSTQFLPTESRQVQVRAEDVMNSSVVETRAAGSLKHLLVSRQTKEKFPPEDSMDDAEEQREEGFLPPSGSITLFLKEMGRVPLLSRDAELHFGKQVKVGKRELLRALSSLPMSLSTLESVRGQLHRGEIQVSEVVIISVPIGQEYDQVSMDKHSDKGQYFKRTLMELNAISRSSRIFAVPV